MVFHIILLSSIILQSLFGTETQVCTSIMSFSRLIDNLNLSLAKAHISLRSGWGNTNQLKALIKRSLEPRSPGHRLNLGRKLNYMRMDLFSVLHSVQHVNDLKRAHVVNESRPKEVFETRIRDIILPPNGLGPGIIRVRWKMVDVENASFDSFDDVNPRHLQVRNPDSHVRPVRPVRVHRTSIKTPFVRTSFLAKI